MTNFRERINSHLPIVLQFLSTASLVVIALSALCGANSLKELSGHHENQSTVNLEKSNTMLHSH